MTDNSSQGNEETNFETDGGVQTANYLDKEINIFKPATPFMRDHMKVIIGSFIAWILFVFGPVTATAIAPEIMTETMVMGFQLHYFLTAVMAPLGALLLSAAYAWQRDRLDDQYGIEHGDEADAGAAVAADGGEE
ncbi:DUF4212 domain-containing protein [Halostagnicola sp. A-GB9-2]|uniref:DUF4212 domain-containing protein n=1 Tax=Halostagnicola sp. A-GB9-2 TaxID=3048066 RepID=UPI0024C0594A|nr:DUF4212 domain-containing protein [Halostagnicola sp. A-GB9-2]MDJ1430704.1 DUF4212 domain-containing protein [Halostagnicola sp. A-GB9-2]